MHGARDLHVHQRLDRSDVCDTGVRANMFEWGHLHKSKHLQLHSELDRADLHDSCLRSHVCEWRHLQ
jgi:hypothetical protein